MRIRAVIFDVYQTILEVGLPPASAARQWESLWRDTIADPPRLALQEFAAQCDRVIAREHAAAREFGVQNPEVYWPAVASEVLPELARLSDFDRDEFLYRHAQLLRSIRLMPGAARFLQTISEQNSLIG